jgi:hypothetical protein
LDLLGTVEETSPYEVVAKGDAISQLWMMPPENRVSGQYIVLEASPGPSDLTLWIQGLLGMSITFIMTPPKPHKSLQSWLD